MGRLTDITLEELRELHKRTDGETPRERILAAIGRKQGDQIDTLAERHSVAEKTIRNWLDRGLPSNRLSRLPMTRIGLAGHRNSPTTGLVSARFESDARGIEFTEERHRTEGGHSQG